MTAPLALCVRHSRPTEPSVAESVALRVPSDVNHVEAAVELMTRHCFSGLCPSSQVVFRLRVALSEALANAIRCGNREDPAKGVTVSDHQINREMEDLMVKAVEQVQSGT